MQKKEIEKIVVDAESEEIHDHEDRVENNHRLAIVYTSVESNPYQGLGFGFDDRIARKYMTVQFKIEIWENGCQVRGTVYASDFDLYSYHDDEQLKQRILKDIKEPREWYGIMSSEHTPPRKAPWDEEIQIRDDAGVLKWLLEPKQLAQYFFQVEN